ncbi:restriction endonuclease subunit S [bacterium]|nr:restriction endonuclease subunit S [bacterium]
MSEWKEVRLGNCIEVIGGGTPKTKNPEYWNGSIPWLSVVDFNSDDKYVYDTEKKITQLGFNKSSTKLLQKNDIIISARGTVGAMAILKKEMAFNQSCYGIRALKDISTNNFVYYFLKNSLTNLKQISHGAVFDTITRNTFNEITISLPPLPEQKAIAEVLSSLDDKIDLLGRQNKTLEEMAETLFRQWFIEERDESWEDVSLGDSSLCKIIGSGIDVFEGEKIYLATADIQENKIVNRNTIIKYNKKPSRANMQPVVHSVWFAKKGGVRKVIMFDRNTLDDTESLILSTGFSGLKTTVKSHYYIWCFIYSREFQELKDNLLSGSVQPDINNDGIRNIVIARPSDKTLVDFNEVVYPLFRKISKNNKSVGILMNLRDTLLPKLISGEVRLKYGK